jgi:hypothetical protein
MARARRRAYLFHRKGGSYKRFRGNPFKKHIVRGRNPFKKKVVLGHYDASGKFHRRKNIAGFKDWQGKYGPVGMFHPIRAGTGPSGEKWGYNDKKSKNERSRQKTKGGYGRKKKTAVKRKGHRKKKH